LDAFISASAVGIYGAVNGEEICTENTAFGDDFLGLTCGNGKQLQINLKN
jgi:NAD dependent epimerase/dehydratase family enzyme